MSMLHIDNRYFYSFLSTKEKQLFEIVFNGVNQRKTRFKFRMVDVNVDKVIEALSYDCPELYNIKSWGMTYTESEIWFSDSNPFIYSLKEETEIKKRLDDIVFSFPEGQDDFSKELSVHNYIVKTCTFDQEYKNRAKNSKLDYENHSIVGPLVRGVGVCSGFAKATQYLLMRLGIPVIYCTGRITDALESEGHAWTIVNIQSQYYHLDVSHDVCLSEDLTVPRYSYFNVTDLDIKKDHIIDSNKYKKISCVSNLLNYYQKFNRYYTNRTQIRNSVLTFIQGAYALDTSRRIDFRVSSSISEADVHTIMLDIMNSTERVQGFTFSGGALNTFSVSFDLTPIL